MRKRITVPILALNLPVLLLTSFTYGQLQVAFQVAFSGVGKGDSILLYASDNADILLGAGPRSAGPTVVAQPVQ